MSAPKKIKATAVHTFKWKGINRKGGKIDGEFQGVSVAEVKANLRKQGVNVTRIQKVAKPLFSFGKKISPMDIALISRQIATMLGAGVPLVQTLSLIAHSTDNVPLRELMSSVSNEISTGTPMSKALREHPKYFDDLYCDLVDAGEQSGALDTIYDRIAIYKEKSEALKSKIKKAMFYPTAVLVVAGLVTLLLLLFVIPQFKTIFAGFGAELPAFTLFVLHISDLVKEYWYLIGIFFFGSVWAFKKAYAKSEKFRNQCDKLELKIPVISTILEKAAVARFARTLSTTFAAGIPLIDALISASGASGNYVYRSAITKIRTEVMAGMQMNVAMKMTGTFPEMLSQMVMIGEESGNLDNMLSKVADIYEQQVDDAVDALTSLLEPFIMVVLGIIVGGLIVAMYLPIFELGSVIG
ncbi:type II secretion system protein, type IV pilus biogenesis protein PilC [Psychromonas sp. CNPT3]|uniref:type II secretion system F family protein n=1 Tax=Psychromonas sp. CNPT3 TaxID=314282 RepID=UPI00006E9EB0|nr:type II secretion system F family protein [Psychromonas sp. CNPT3]AGH82169.1 type II secretion system protein, type IV pilus biogenesis protein PilC [Psychromonas sp. CNPT3]